ADQEFLERGRGHRALRAHADLVDPRRRARVARRYLADAAGNVLRLRGFLIRELGARPLFNCDVTTVRGSDELHRATAGDVECHVDFEVRSALNGGRQFHEGRGSLRHRLAPKTTELVGKSPGLWAPAPRPAMTAVGEFANISERPIVTSRRCEV